MRSLINGKEYGGDTYLVTLLVQNSSVTNQHARLIIEGEKSNMPGECWYFVCDFIPDDDVKTGGLKKGKVRAAGSMSFFNQEDNPCYDYALFNRIGDNLCPFKYIGRSKIEATFSFKKGDKCHSWLIDSATIKKLLRDIARDSMSGDLFYEQFGSASALKRDYRSHNCITWVNEKLKNCDMQVIDSFLGFIAEQFIAIPGLYTSEHSNRDFSELVYAIRQANTEVMNASATSAATVVVATTCAAITTADAAALPASISASLSHTLLSPPIVSSSSSAVLTDEQIAENIAFTRSEEDAKKTSSTISGARVTPR